LANKVLLPVLGDQFGRVLEEGQLALTFDGSMFWLNYFQRHFPLAPDSYATILGLHLDQLREKLGEENLDLLEYLSILTAIQNLPPRTETDSENLGIRRREKELIKRRLHELVTRSGAVREHLEANLRQLNGTRGDPRSFDPLETLLEQQAYRL